MYKAAVIKDCPWGQTDSSVGQSREMGKRPTLRRKWYPQPRRVTGLAGKDGLLNARPGTAGQPQGKQGNETLPSNPAQNTNSRWLTNLSGKGKTVLDLGDKTEEAVPDVRVEKDSPSQYRRLRDHLGCGNQRGCAPPLPVLLQDTFLTSSQVTRALLIQQHIWGSTAPNYTHKSSKLSENMCNDLESFCPSETPFHTQATRNKRVSQSETRGGQSATQLLVCCRRGCKQAHPPRETTWYCLLKRHMCTPSDQAIPPVGTSHPPETAVCVYPRRQRTFQKAPSVTAKGKTLETTTCQFTWPVAGVDN